MKTSVSLLFLCSFALLLSVTSSETDEHLNSIINILEMEFDDSCEKRANANWQELIGDEKGLANKLESDKAFGLEMQSARSHLVDAMKGQKDSVVDEVLKRKVKLLLHPGDVMLDIDQWIKLVSFAVSSQHKLRFATNYDCGASNCSLREFHVSYASQQDEETLRRMKKSWDGNLPDITEYLETILPLVTSSAKEEKSVEEYWDSLVEYEGAILKARELWDSVKPLYTKLHNYIAFRLQGADAVGKPLPVHLLRSLNGDDWSNVIESLLPKHPGVYQKVLANLQLKNLGGIEAYKAAADLIDYLKIGKMRPEVLSESIFNSSCPATLVDWCKPNKMRVATCKDVSIANYLDAHEAAMKIVYKQTTAAYSKNTFIIREAPRYSAIYEAIPGFISLLALSPHGLDRNGLFPIETFNYNANHHRLVLQLILALRDLPKLNFYLAADEWRLKVLMGTMTTAEAASSWVELRKEFSMLETSDRDFLADPYVVLNKPFIGKFMGLILKYQIYQSFAEELESDESDLLQHVASNNDRLNKTIMQGYIMKWSELVSDLLAKREDRLEYTGLTDYYRFLDEYLDEQFDPSLNELEILDDYYVPVDAPKADFDFDGAIEVDVPYDESVTDNSIDTGDRADSKYETSTVTVLEIKNPIKTVDHKNDVAGDESSYNVYWWIGLGVALAVVAMLIAIIARKRHNHRKQLERQRETSRA